VLLARLIEQMNLIRGGDRDGRVDRDVAYRDTNDLLVTLLELLELDLRKQAHALYKV